MQLQLNLYWGHSDYGIFTLKDGLKQIYKLDREIVIKACRNPKEYITKPLKLRLINYEGTLTYLNCYINQASTKRE